MSAYSPAEAVAFVSGLLFGAASVAAVAFRLGERSERGRWNRKIAEARRRHFGLKVKENP